MALKFEHVPGRNAGKVTLYALSTCGWCRRTRALLAELGVAYEFVYVDLLTGSEGDEAIAEVTRWNPKSSFPTIVLDSKRAIAGFDENAIREALSK